MKTHTLKIKETYFFALLSWEKKAEIRFNDRDFQKGDNINFDILWTNPHEDRPEGLERETWKITHVLHFPDWLRDGYVCLSLKKIR